MDFWETWTFADLLAEPVRNGIYKKKKFHGKGQKVINMGELFSYDFISNQEMRRIELNDRELANYLVKDGDLLFARRSFVLEGSGKCSLVVQPSENTTFESSIIRARPNPDWTDPHFYYYLFRSPQGRALISSIATRTAVSGIRGSELALLKVPKPPLPTQRKIATVLSTYDNLIENNTRRIKTLEEMASAIYREWFVEFRFPGHEGVEMVESELGLIPQGWEIGRLGDLCAVVPGYAFKSKDWQDTGVAVVKIKNIKSDNTIDVQDMDRIPPEILLPKLDKYRLKNGDFLIAMTGATAGKVGRLRTTTTMMLNQRVAKIDPIDGYRDYIWCKILLEETQKEFFYLADGAAQPNMSGSQIENYKIVCPPQSMCNNFSSIVGEILIQTDNLILRNANLRKTRDLLLPKLISGEIDVSEPDINID